MCACKLGSSQTALNHIEQGKENVTLKTIQTLCRHLKCSVGDLFDDAKKDGLG
jgi:DNA-binding Xre family transcriptional regulator